MRRRWMISGWAVVPVLVVAAAAILSLGGADSAFGVQPVNFTRGTVAGSGFATTAPGSLEFGPDGRLYVADTNGRIQALTLNPTTKAVTAVQQITTATQLQEVFGIAFDPTIPYNPGDPANPPPIYVTNTLSGFAADGIIAPPSGSPGSYPGKVTKISGAGYATRTDIITGLPASNSGHQANGLAFGPDGRLYIGQGSTTNGGVIAPGGGLFQREEVALSGTILVADVKAPGFNGNITYTPQDIYSQFVQQTGGDVSIFAYGLRNPYDVVWHTNGVFYNTDNGPNSGYGPGSATCSSVFGTDAQAADELNIIEAGDYYGHPNRNRGATDSRQCLYHPGTDPSTANYTAPIDLLGPSSDGLAEYKSGVFAGQMQGDLLYVGWVENDLHRVELSPDGSSVTSNTMLANGFGNPLDVAVGADGTIYVAEYSGNKITFLKPNEALVTDITVGSIFPPGGPLVGGQAVTITGTNFTTTADTVVTIGGVALGSVVVENSTTITGVTTAVGTAGARDVTVTNSVGNDTLVGGYNYSAGGGIYPPVSDAGDDFSSVIAHENHAHVILDGRGSTDPDPGGFIASYEWKEGATVLSTQSVDSKQFTQGEHFVTLTVTDGDGQTDTDIVRINITAVAENPEPYYCADVTGDGSVNATDLSQVAQRFGKTWYNNRHGGGYGRLADINSDMSISSIDLSQVAQDFTTSCPQLDRDIRTAVLGTEPFMDINNALTSAICVTRSANGIEIIAVALNASQGSCPTTATQEWYQAGYSQTTPYIPGQGRHMGKGGGIFANDETFEAERPESLLYKPDSSKMPGTNINRFPGGWRLGGLMYVVPITLVPLPPDGFPTYEDPWHYHDGLCLWNNGGSVAQNVTQAFCSAQSGNPVFIEKAGWLVHLWGFWPNQTGRFTEISPTF